ncbi:MAG TPA: tail fiber domain-containing protein [Patescibacteria group bacterium]|nr:tail fiber domain-containing protein [Patescibacteria group bacterium]
MGTTSYRSLVVTTSGNVGVGTTSAPSPLFLPTSSSKIREIGNITNTGANMAMQGRYIYTSDSTNKKFNIIDISNPAAPSIVGSMTFGSSDALGRIVVSGKLAFVTATTSPALHIIDISNPTAPVLKSSTSVPSVAFTMAASGKYIYTGNLSSSVQIYDASVPTNPALVYTLPLSTFMSLGMQIRGKYMYVGERDGVNIRLYDISNPSNPSLVSNYVLTGSQFSNMTVEDKYVYAIVVTASGGRDLQILDYSNPTSPTLVNTISLNSTANLPVVKGRYLYMTGSSGISVYDLVNPSSPTLSAVIPTNTVNYFEVAGRLLYYIESSGSGQVRVLDIGGAFLSNIESATMDTGDLQVRELLTAASARFSDLAIMNQGALINTRFDVVGTSSFIGNIGIGTGTPTAALHFLGTGTGIRFADGSLMTTASIGSANSMANVTDLVMNADSDANSSGAVRLQTAATDRLYITNVGNVGIGTNTPAQLLVVGSQSARSLTFNGNTGSLNVVGNVGIGTVTAPTSALSVQGNITAIGNISSLANANLAPTFVSSASTGGSIKNLVIQGRYAYLAQASGGTANLYIYDVTRSTNPALITSLAVGSSNGGVGIKVQGKYAYIVSAGDDTLRIVDISNPATPYIVGSINSGDDPWEVFVQGKYAYVANGTGQTMQIVDISNPTAPVLAGSVGSLGANSRRVVVQGRYAYVSNNAGQVFVIDISNPSAPATIVTYTPGCSAFDLAAQGRYLYLACGNGELRIVDIKNPASPSATSTTVVDGIELDAIHVSGRYVYLGAHSNQSNFYVLDVSNPSLPVKVGTLVSAFGLNAYINAIEVSGRYAYIATDSGTFNVVDVSGAEFTSALVHSLESGNIQSRGDIFAQGNMNAGSSLFVGQGGILSAGGLSIVSTSTHSYFGGNVGIGTSTPSLTFVVGSQTARSLFFDANTGNFGIGTSAPTATLAVGGSMFVAGSSTHMNGINLTAGCFAVNGNCFVQGTSSQWGAIGTSTSIYYTLGNVGIGTTTPNALFTVTGTSLIQGLTVGLGFNSIASNSAFGVSALSSNTSGQFNTALGYQALRFNTTGQSNTATGYQALVSNSSGQANTAYGLQSLNSSSTGSYNVGMGNYALFNNTTGRKNVAVGYQALYDLNILDGSDSNNTAIGFNTGLGILTGKNNTIIGANVTGLSSTLSDNIIIADGNGNQRINVTGSGNLGIGTSTPQSLFIVGSQTGRSLAFDANNAFVGIGTTTGLSYALDIQKFSYSPEGIRVRNKGNGSGSAAAILFEINDSATTPFRIQANSSANTAYGGAYSLNMVNDYNAPITFNTQVGEVLRVTGNGNVGIGTITPQAVLTVGSSTAVHGSGAGLPKLFAVGGTQTGNMFTVTNNGLVGIGIASPSYSLDINASTYSDGMRIQTNRIFSSINLINNSSGGHSWFISSHGGSSPGAGTLAFYDQTAAEYRMQINGSGNLRLNAYGAGTLVTDASGNVTASSDERLKNITGTFTRGLAEVLELNPIVYTWNTLSGMETATAYSGFSAQNIQAHIPEAVSQDTRGYLTLQDRPLLAALVNAVKELASSASEQQKQINDLQTAISKVSPKLAGLDVLLGSDETLAQRLEQLESRILNLESKFASLDAALKAAGSNGQIQISNFTGGVVADLTATGAVRFLQDVAMEGHLLVSNDTAGKATVTTGTSTVHVAYAKPYASKPNVTISLKTPIKLDWYVVKNETETGFDIEIAPVVAVDVEFTWISLGVAVVPDSDGRQNGEQVANPDYQVGPPPTSDPLNVGSDSQSRVPATATHADTEDTSATADVLSPTDSSLSNPSDIGPIGSISNPVSTSNSDTTTEVSIQQ